MPDAPKIKSCPFCGKPAQIEIGGKNYAVQIYCDRHGPGSNIRFFGSTLATAVARWNARAKEDDDG